MFSPSKVQITVYVVKLLFYNPETKLNPILTDYCYYIPITCSLSYQI